MDENIIDVINSSNNNNLFGYFNHSLKYLEKYRNT